MQEHMNAEQLRKAKGPRFKGRDNTKYGKRHTPGVMNKTEEAYAGVLADLVTFGEVLRWEFEAVTFKLAKDCRYTPDFMVLFKDGTMEFIDAKGGGPMDDKSRVKARVAAEKFPQFTFAICQRLPKKKGGGWKREEF